MNQISFDPLNYADAKEALIARNTELRKLRKAGKDAYGWRLTGQLKKYESFGVPDGRIRDVYYITIND